MTNINEIVSISAKRCEFATQSVDKVGQKKEDRSEEEQKREKDKSNLRLYSTVQKEMHDSLDDEEEDFY